MARRQKHRPPPKPDVAEENVWAGHLALLRHPLFRPLMYRASIDRRAGNLGPAEGWAVVTNNGDIHVHPTRRGDPAEWANVLAHCLLHLAFGHFQQREHPRAWNAACDVVVARFLAPLKVGRPPAGYELPDPPWTDSEERLYQLFCEQGPPIGDAGDLRFEPVRSRRWGTPVDWQRCFGEGLAAAVTEAVNVAGGLPSGAAGGRLTAAQAARGWFISSYPLLGALAAAFNLVEDPRVCARLGITIAAVDAESREIFVNPAAGLDEQELRFVLAHKLLHVGLRHDSRRRGRDPELWNVACDFVVNGWLLEMGVGALPRGLLYDPALRGESAEAVYDRVVTDLRRYRKLATLRGVGLGDMLDRGRADWWASGEGLDLDAFYRSALGRGLWYHTEQSRGFLPAALEEEIRALSQPPVPWDVELARWFDHHIPPPERVRSYARPSRRQQATPEIPRPSLVRDADGEAARTFGVVLDTSGSMDRTLLAKALGAIAGYSMAREVPAVRVVFCDAATYDQGYMPAEAIAQRVTVKGRGGTVLQPAIDLLERATDFPADGSLLIITDGWCDRLWVRREHAYLMPEAARLPFVPKGPVFRLK